jgi:antitoxin component HigA of HigAB toxin-antitoxin module
MKIKPIKNEVDNREAIQRIEALWGSKRDTPEGDELDLLTCTPILLMLLSYCHGGKSN